LATFEKKRTAALKLMPLSYGERRKQKSQKLFGKTSTSWGVSF